VAGYDMQAHVFYGGVQSGTQQGLKIFRRVQAHIVAAVPTKAFTPASTPTASKANETHVAPLIFDRVAHQNFVRF
jgi:hypothetical protein